MLWKFQHYSSQGTTVSGVLANKQTNKQIVAQGKVLKDKYISNIDNGITIDPKLADLVISLVSIAIKVIASAVNTIKNLINDEIINTFEKVLSDSDLPVKKTMSGDKIMSDDKLTLNAINLLRGKIFIVYI